MKICSNCVTSLSLDCFYKDKNTKDGLTYVCKKCAKIKADNWRKENKQKHLSYSKTWYGDNLEKAIGYRKKYYEENAISIRQKTSSWKKENKGKVVANTTYRKKYVKRATPVWANLTLIGDFYKQAEVLTQLTGIKHSVDHIIPLRGKFVSGLHVEDNLRVIPLSENLAKGNRHE